MFSRVLLILLFCVLVGGNSFADRLVDVKKSGILKVGVSYDSKPFSFIDKSESLYKVVGFDIELLKYIANEWDVELVLQQITSKDEISMIQTNKIDLITLLMSDNIDKNSSIEFTQEYFYDGQVILVNTNSKKKSLTSLSGSKVGILKNSGSGKNLRQYSKTAIIIEYENYLEAIEDLKKGSIDAITSNLVWCSTQVKNSNGKLKIIGNMIFKKII